MRYLAAIICLWSSTVLGTTWICPDTSFTMVNSNVQVRAVDGDTVSVPAGVSDWGANVLTITNAIIFQGAGTNQTVFKGSAQGMITVSPHSAAVPILKGFNLDGKGASNYMLRLRGFTGGANPNGSAILVTSCLFTNDPSGIDCVNSDNNIGLIDHCIFVDYNLGIQTANSAWGGQQNGDGSWTNSDNFGTTNALYVEHCAFYGGGQIGAIDSVSGARWVFRFNFVTNDIVVYHGTDSTRRQRGTRAVEIYNNELDAPSNFGNEGRSGASLIYSNNCINFSHIMTYKEFREASCGVPGSYPPWGAADGTSLYDTNFSGACQLALDQVGRGAGTLLSGGDDTTGPSPASWPSEIASTNYVWRNTNNGVLSTANNCSPLIVNGRDYTNSAAGPIGYTPLIYPHPLLQVADPFVTLQPTDQSVTAPATATFTCAFAGSTWPGTIQWYRNSVAIGGATSSSYTTPATSAPDDGSQFYAIGTDSAGSAQTVTATLHVSAGSIIGGSSGLKTYGAHTGSHGKSTR